ncbi:MAG: 50S ribosomal protein L25 [Pseudomonadota bacterium]
MLMEVGKLTVESRNTVGKNCARRLRACGKVPGICYGGGQEPLLIALEARALRRSLDPERKRNTLISMTLKNADGSTKELTVMVKDSQLDSLTSALQHVDFVTVDPKRDVTVNVPIVLTGKSLGVVAGGQLHAVYRELPVSCKPSDIPAKIEIDVSAMGLGDALHVSDLTLPPGIRAALGGGETIASIVAPKAEKTAAEEAAEVAATAEAAAGTATGGAAAATTAEAPAKPAKPAKGGE